MEIQKLYQQAIKFASSKHAAMGQKVPGTATARILSRGIIPPPSHRYRANPFAWYYTTPFTLMSFISELRPFQPLPSKLSTISIQHNNYFKS